MQITGTCADVDADHIACAVNLKKTSICHGFSKSCCIKVMYNYYSFQPFTGLEYYWHWLNTLLLTMPKMCKRSIKCAFLCKCNTMKFGTCLANMHVMYVYHGIESHTKKLSDT